MTVLLEFQVEVQFRSFGKHWISRCAIGIPLELCVDLETGYNSSAKFYFTRIFST